MRKTIPERFETDRPVAPAVVQWKGAMARLGKSTTTTKGAVRARLVLRHCRVCEWKDQVVETSSGLDSDCPWCHGPTAVDDTEDVEASPDEAGSGKNPHAAALGRLGGIKGGHVRAQKLSAKRRREIASKAARARWNKR